MITTPMRLAGASATALLLLGLTACASASDSSGSGGSSATAVPTDLIAAAEAAAVSAAKEEGATDAGGQVTIIGNLTGEEGDALYSAMKPFQTATGITVNYTGSQDSDTQIKSQVDAGSAPDVVYAARIGAMKDYAEQGLLVPLGDILGDELTTDSYNQGLLDAVTIDGEQYGTWVQLTDSMIWYSPTSYEGPTEPETWDELMSWSEEQAASGTAPWCMALEAGAGTGYPGKTFIQDVFAKMYGADAMAEWVDGDIKWTDPQVKAAFERFGEIATSDTLVNGGPAAVLSTNTSGYSTGMFTDPAQCNLTLWGNFAAGLIQAEYPEVELPDDLTYFRIPGDDKAVADSVEPVSGQVTYAFSDSPQTRAFLRYWAGVEAQSLVADTGRWTVANENVPLEVYPNAAIQASAELLKAQNVTFAIGPDTAATGLMNSTWNKVIANYVQDPSTLDAGLAELQAVAESN